jgi:diguanylate cyclase (GGDEF)-like protein
MEDLMKLQQRMERSHLIAAMATILFYLVSIIALYIIFIYTDLSAQWAGQEAAYAADDISHLLDGDHLIPPLANDLIYGLGIVQIYQQNPVFELDQNDMDWMVILGPDKKVLASNLPELFPENLYFSREFIEERIGVKFKNASLESYYYPNQRIHYMFASAEGNHFGLSEILDEHDNVVGYLFLRFTYVANPLTSNEVLYFLIGGLLITVSLSVAFGIFLSKHMSKSLVTRIQKITSASQQLADGKNFNPIEGADSDEIDQLANTFNQMAATIRNQMNSLRDEMELKQSIQTELEYMASYDSLTNLLNRRTFMNRAELEFLRNQRYQHPISVLMIDIDDFKDINDTYGHQTGDLVLSKVGETIALNVRNHDLCGRYGGEEFIILMPESDAHEAENLANRILEKVNRISLNEEGFTFSVSCSIGLADNIGIKNADLKKIITLADTCLYEAKRTGKNKVIHYN